MSNFGALVEGLTTVRAFRAQHRFQDRVISVTDNFQKMDHFYWSLQAVGGFYSMSSPRSRNAMRVCWKAIAPLDSPLNTETMILFPDTYLDTYTKY